MLEKPDYPSLALPTTTVLQIIKVEKTTLFQLLVIVKQFPHSSPDYRHVNRKYKEGLKY